MGDFFCEIASAKTALTSKTILAESQIYVQQQQESLNAGEIDRLTFTHKVNGKSKININVDIDYRSFNDILEKSTPESADKTDRKKTKELEELSTIMVQDSENPTPLTKKSVAPLGERIRKRFIKGGLKIFR